MNVWGVIAFAVVSIAAFIMLLSIAINISVAWVGRRFSKKVLQKNMLDFELALPGTNCGKCGFSCCTDYAHSVFVGTADTNLCVAGGEKTQKDLDALVNNFQELLEA